MMPNLTFLKNVELTYYMDTTKTMDHFIFHCPPQEPVRLFKDNQNRIKISNLFRSGLPRQLAKFPRDKKTILQNFQILKGLSLENVWKIKEINDKKSTWVHPSLAKIIISWWFQIPESAFDLVQGDRFIPRQLKNSNCSFPKNFPPFIKPFIEIFYPWLKIPQISKRNLNELHHAYQQGIDLLNGREYSTFEFRRVIPLPILLQLVCVVPSAEVSKLLIGIKWSLKNPLIGEYLFYINPEGILEQPVKTYYYDIWPKEVGRGSIRCREERNREDFNDTNDIFEFIQKDPSHRDLDTIEYEFRDFCKDWALSNSIIKTRDEKFLNWSNGFKLYKKYHSI